MKRALAPGYDLFKLVVTLILAAILFILLLRGCGPTPGSQPTATGTYLSPPTTATAMPLTRPTATANQPPSPEPAPTATPTDAPTPTPEPPPAAVPTPQIPPSTPQAGPANPDCPGAAVSRIKVGDRVRVMANLNLRRDPRLSGAWILTHTTGTELEIIGGPGCTPIDQQAYQWWQVRRPDGREGWSAEAALRGQFYFLEPIP